MLGKRDSGALTYHEITLDIFELARETLFDGVPGGALNLVVVVVETGDVAVGELGDLSGGTTNTATNIQNLVTGLDADLHGEVVLMTSNGLVEALTERVATEVEGLAPAILIQIGGQVVVVSGQSRVLLGAGLDRGMVSTRLERKVNS